jgi:hypothetical protein
MTLEQFLAYSRYQMTDELNDICRELKRDMKRSPEEYTEHGCDEPSIDIRLCVDYHEHKPSLPGEYNYIFRIGLVDFDPIHSDYCAASCVALDTKPDELLKELTEQILLNYTEVRA